MKPLFPWIGSKRDFVRRLVPRSLAYTRVIEPFAGGASLFFHCEKSGVLLDRNSDLIRTYQWLAQSPMQFSRLLDALCGTTSESTYYTQRDQFNRHVLDGIHRSVQMLYLMLACRNGVWRVNRSGDCNSPYGFRKRIGISASTIINASRLLNRCTFGLDWTQVIRFAAPGDLIYFDPPYSTGFDDYTTQRVAWDSIGRTANSLATLGCHVAVTDYDGATRDFFPGWRKLVVNRKVRVNPQQPVVRTEITYLSYPA